MSPTHYAFQYDGGNLEVFSQSLGSYGFIAPFFLVVFVALYAGVYFLAPHIYSSLIYREKQQEKNAKRNLIKDLIIMKEIQTELEKEIEQSLLNVGMQKSV